MKSKLTGVKNTLEVINSTLDDKEELISDL